MPEAVPAFAGPARLHGMGEMGNAGNIWPVAEPIVDEAVGTASEYGRRGIDWAEEQLEDYVIDPLVVPALSGLVADVEQSQTVWVRVVEECARAEAVCRQTGALGWVSTAAEGFRARVDEHGREVGSLATAAQAVVEAYEQYLVELRSSPVGRALGL